jgi:hypothetical protein
VYSIKNDTATAIQKAMVKSTRFIVVNVFVVTASVINITVNINGILKYVSMAFF